MKVHYCDHCGRLVFFENTRCLNCDSLLAFVPDRAEVAALRPAQQEGRWLRESDTDRAALYRLCRNYTEQQVCNWAVPEADSELLCCSCRLTETIPDLGVPGNRQAWYRLELAKRRLLYSLLTLGLPIADRRVDPALGLAFRFLAEAPGTEAGAVTTGHADGVITVNLAEADDAEREKRRTQLHEPYRTLLGHFRHESGHYYWQRLLQGERLEAFRACFGDEREDYAAALQRHYEQGAPADWQQRYVSAYASAHPWEDWAETWAHYLHMTDTLETAAESGLSLLPERHGAPVLKKGRVVQAWKRGNFDDLIAAWFPLTHVLNNLNRGLGQPDAYPFVLSAPAIDKLRWVHETIETGGHQPSPAARA